MLPYVIGFGLPLVAVIIWLLMFRRTVHRAVPLQYHLNRGASISHAASLAALDLQTAEKLHQRMRKGRLLYLVVRAYLEKDGWEKGGKALVDAATRRLEQSAA